MKKEEVEDVYKGLNPAQKTAFLLITLGQRWATEVMRFLKEDEVKQISYWINQMHYVPQEINEKIVKEFYGKLVNKASLGSSGGKDYLFDILNSIMGDEKAIELIDDLGQSEESDVFRVLRKIEPSQLAAYLIQEQPQTIALMLSYLQPKRAASIIRELPDEMKAEVMFQMAKLQGTDPEVIETMDNALRASLGAVADGKQMEIVGGVKVVAEILNNLDQVSNKLIMSEINDRDLDLAVEIKELLFVFDDVATLDDKSVQLVLKEVPQEDLIIALKGASAAVKEIIFRNMSKRGAEGIQDELAFMGPIKGSTITEVHKKIVNIIRKLEEEGKVYIQKGGEDDVVS
jgi:flagellar motor switch protein FliG